MKILISSRSIGIVLLLASLNATAQDSYGVRKTFHIKSSGGWDYLAVSPSSDNLYISHGMQVNIVNKTTGDSTGIIEHTDGVHGIVFAPRFKKGFTSNGKLNTVSVFDIKTNQVLDQVKTGSSPDAMIFDEFTKLLFVCNGHSADMTVIDPATNKVKTTVPLGGKPETPVSDNKGRLFINIEDKNEIAVVNAKTFKIEHRWKTGTGEEPTGLAFDVKTKRLFAGCGNKILVVLNAENGKVVKELPIGDGCDGVAFDAGTKTIFAANGEGTLTIIKEKAGKGVSELVRKLML